MARKTKSTLAHAKNITLRKMKIKYGYTLYLDIYSNGKRKKEYLHLQITGNKDVDKDTLELAKRIHAKRILELQSLDYDEFDRGKINSNFIEFYEDLSKKKHIEGKRKTNKWTNTLNHIKGYAGKEVTFKQLTPQWLDGFKEYLLSKLKRNSAATYYESVKAALNLAVRNRIIKENPCNYTDNITRKQNERVFLYIEEIAKLDSTECPNNPDVKKAFLFACFSGLRLSDVKALTWKQVNKNGTLKFRQKKTGEYEIMPLSEQALNYLGEFGKPDEKIFKLKEDENTRRILIKWAESAKLGKIISFHTSRHTFATMALTYGVDIYTVSKLLGHSELKNTQIYAKLVDKKKQEAVNMLPKL